MKSISILVAIMLLAILVSAAQTPKPVDSRFTCKVTEKVNPVTPEFALSCDCHTLWTVECPTRNRKCEDDDMQPNCAKTILDIPNSKWPKAWASREYIGAIVKAQWEDKSLVAVSAQSKTQQ